MTNNFELFKNYMRELGIPEKKEKINDKVFEVQLLRRGKDHPDLPAANYSFKNYYIDSIEIFERLESEIITCCNTFGLRAYISVNVKSKTKLQLECLKIISDNLCMGELKKPWKTFYKAFGNTKAEEQRWIVDVDNPSIIIDVVRIIESCQSGYDTPIICTVPTKSGIHVITHPFNLAQYQKGLETYGINDAEVKKNHITLLYEDLPEKVQWTGDNLKEVIDFTGFYPKASEWFKSWEEYENYVKEHNNIFKIFCSDNTHYEVYPGCWIAKVKGYNVPISKGKFKVITK